MKLLLAFTPAVLAGVIPGGVGLGEAPPPGQYCSYAQVTIGNVTYGGTGCPQGTLSAQLNTDKTLVTIIFDAYIASIGPGVAVTEQRKNCQLNIDIRYPGGFQYSVLSADYRGYASIQKGVTGTLKSTYYFSGQTDQSTTDYTFTGPVTGDYLKHDTADSVSTVWSPCGTQGLLNINSQVRLSSTESKATGLLTTDSTDLKFTQVAYVQWQKCQK
ncbi:secreted protein [Paraphaeosphaeria minitans]|uniref:Secreted protein n=1 Tax=Paraphaeosphaeria minitans TaxID=565426 RepID=A0A9P6GDL5_9PLEO|nr:secreted protein [Paraphaeosphaeria minitans]